MAKVYAAKPSARTKFVEQPGCAILTPYQTTYLFFMRPLLVAIVLCCSITVSGQSKQELFKKVETLLNKVNGQKVDAALAKDWTIKEQVFGEKGIGYSFKGDDGTNRVEYEGYSWKDFFYTTSQSAKSDMSIVILKIKFKTKLKYYSTVTGSQYMRDGSKIGPKESYYIELYCYRSDYDEIEGLIKKIAVL